MLSALLFAAGRSRRMGMQKLLLPWRGKPMVAHVVDELLRSPVEDVVVVVGSDGKPIRDAIADRQVRVVINPQPEAEMLDSVRCGLRAISEDVSAVVVALGDQPGITAEVVETLTQCFQTMGRGIVVPVYQGKRGHPLLFSTAYRDEILARHEGRGLRGLLDAHPEDVYELEVGTSGVLQDVDSREDYRRMIERPPDGPV